MKQLWGRLSLLVILPRSCLQPRRPDGVPLFLELAVSSISVVATNLTNYTVLISHKGAPENGNITHF